MADIPITPGSEPRYTGPREGEQLAYRKDLDRSTQRDAAWMAKVIGGTAVAAHVFGRVRGSNYIARGLDLIGASAKFLGGFYRREGASIIRPEVAERLEKALNTSMTTKAVLLRTRGGTRLDEFSSVQEIIESLALYSDPKYAANRAGLEEGFQQYLSRLPRSGAKPSSIGSLIHHDLDRLTFGDILRANNTFIKEVVTTKHASSRLPLELQAIRKAIDLKWITPDTVIDPKLFRASGTNNLIDTRITSPRYFLDRMADITNMAGITKNFASAFGGRRGIAMLGADEPGGLPRIFIGGDVFEIPHRGSLRRVAKDQRLGEVGDSLWQASTLRRMRSEGRLGEAYTPMPENAGLLMRLQHKIGIGTAFQEKPGGFIQTSLRILRAARAYGRGEAGFVARGLREQDRPLLNALFGGVAPAGVISDVIGPTAIEPAKFAAQAGREVQLNFWERILGFAGAHRDVILVKRSAIKHSKAFGPEDYIHPIKGGGLKQMGARVGVSSEVQGVTRAGEASYSKFAKQYASSAHPVDRAYDFTNYLAMRMNSLASSSLLGIGYRASGSLGANIARLSAIPAIYMTGLESAKYIDYEIGQLTGIRPSFAAADLYTKGRLLQQDAREATGVRKAAEHFEQVFPGVSSGAIGTGVSGAAFYKILQTTGSFKTAGLVAAAIYGAVGGPGVSQRKESLERVYKGEEKVPIRKARYWMLGYQPFVGGAISHFEPSWFIKLKGRAHKTNIYGSESNYWRHGSIIPQPRNLFYLRNLADPYFTEKRSYDSRPYPVTGGFGEEIPVIGPLFADTIGSIIKPRKRMHREHGKATALGNIQNRGVPKDIAAQLGIPGLPLAMAEYGRPDLKRDRLRKYANVALEPTGIWKFALSVLGVKFEKPYQEATSGNMTSRSRAFYEANIGGAFGETEFIRRFILSEYGTYASINRQINSVPNTSPRWLPGRYSMYPEDRGAFFDFTQGDPYTKIPGGEHRLPGAGYEALNVLHGQKENTREKVRFKARVLRVIDADTIDVRLGGGSQRLRMANVMAPERGTTGGEIAAEELKRFLLPGSEVTVETTHDAFGSGEQYGSFGRSLATIYYQGTNVNQAMVDAGMAEQLDPKYDAVDKLMILSDVAPYSRAYKEAQKEVSRMHLSEEWQARVIEAEKQRAHKLDTLGFAKYRQDELAAAELNPVSQSIRDGYLGLHEEILSEIPMVGAKVFPKRRPIEQYRRTIVEGDNFADWTNPWETIARPAIYGMAGDNPIMGTVKGALLGTLVSSRFGAWLNPVQAIAYPKHRLGLIAAAGTLGGTMSMARMSTTGTFKGGYVPPHVREEREVEEYFDKLRYLKYRRIEEAALDTGALAVERYARKQAERTKLYGLHSLQTRGDINSYQSSLHRQEREYFESFSQSRREERAEIMGIVPGHMRQALQAVWGGTEEPGIFVESTPDEMAEEYFETHAVPNANWIGWHPEVPEQAIRIKSILGGINGISDNIHRFNFYPQQGIEAQQRWGYLPSAADNINSTTQGVAMPWRVTEEGGNVIDEFNFGTGPALNVSNYSLYDDREDQTFYYMNYIK